MPSSRLPAAANLYPDSGPRLRQRIAEGAGLSADQVVLGNGSTDIINIVVHTFVAPGEDAVISVPTFPMYEARVRIAGGETVLVPMTKDFYWDVDAILAAVTPTHQAHLHLLAQQPHRQPDRRSPTCAASWRWVCRSSSTRLLRARRCCRQPGELDQRLPAHDGQSHLLQGFRAGGLPHRLPAVRGLGWQTTSTASRSPGMSA